ncbi:B12-binding domain-containing radical SAM protein [Kitasatospora xanthocidica]|uniref:B12-binding domain-containing radical SAM protein n=1 Tax=Kitasatospora xanthocidica TaxID=83382 RepID=UPI0036E08D33
MSEPVETTGPPRPGHGDLPRVLVIWPPQVLSYFNAGHHLALYQVAGHLRATLPDGDVTVVDASVERLTWKDVGNDLFQHRYDVIAVMNDFDGVDGLRRFVTYARALSPRARIVTFGRLSGVNPEYFRTFDLDAVVENGDFEAGVAAAVDVFRGLAEAAPGVHLRRPDGWRAPAHPGRVLPPEHWHLPEPHEIPYERYDELYHDDANKFCGIPRRRELVVPAARGCPIGCSYCEVHPIFGKRERRLTVARTLEYIEKSFGAAPFEYVAFYAPTFTLDRRWTTELCERLTERGAPYPWKCATTVHHLDEELVAAMGRAGCIRISVGLETLDPEGHDALPRSKRKSERDLDELSAWCAAAGIELNCFVMVGLPGSSTAGVRRTIAKVRELGGRSRPTVYTPWEFTRPDMTDEEMAAFNRQLFVPGTHGLDADGLREAYDVVFGRQPDVTAVFEKVPRRGTAHDDAARRAAS